MLFVENKISSINKEVSMARTLGAWDCEYCDTKRIWGNIFDCPGCGKPRSRGVRFYIVDNAPPVTSEIAKVLGSGGPNWYCGHCESGNKDDVTKCWNCGAEKGSSPSHEVKSYSQGAEPRSTKEAELADPDGKSWVDPEPLNLEVSVEKPRQVQYPYAPDFGEESAEPSVFEKMLNTFSESYNARFYAVGGAILLGLVLLFVFVYQFFFKTHVETAQVTGYRWSQNVIVQEYQVVHDSNWTSHPSDAYNVSSDYINTGREQKIHDGWVDVPYQDTCYETVSYESNCTRSVYVSKTCTGYRDNGDGSYDSYDYECGSSESESYSCTLTREDPYSCTKTRQDEVYHYEDIYDWYYEYDINRWVAVANYPTSGENHDPYYFGDFVLKSPFNGNGTPELGQQQQSQNPGTYSVDFFCPDNIKIGSNGHFKRDYPLEVWKLFEMGKGYHIEVNFLNVIITYPNPITEK